MNNPITQDAFRASLNRRLSALRADPQLARRIQSAGKQKDFRPAKPLLTLGLALLLCVLLITGALAAALHLFGILHFAGKSSHAYTPSSAASVIRPQTARAETAHVLCILQETYYDGKILRVTARLVPKEKTLLISGDTAPGDPASALFQAPDAQGLSLAEYALNHYDGRMADISLHGNGDNTHDFLLHADGSATLYLECIFPEEKTDRETELTLVYLPLRIAGDAAAAADGNNRERAFLPLTLHATDTQTYTSHEPLPFPSAGVKVTCVTMTVTPLEIRYTLDYEITDAAAFSAQQGGLWFEFIDPNSTETAYAAQRLSDGLTASGSAGRVDGLYNQPDEAGVVYRQTDALGLDAWGQTFTLRAYNARDKARYETRTIHMTEKGEQP